MSRYIEKIYLKALLKQVRDLYTSLKANDTSAIPASKTWQTIRPVVSLKSKVICIRNEDYELCQELMKVLQI